MISTAIFIIYGMVGIDIYSSVILQNLAQIKTMYKDDWESIVGNCDSMVFLGGKEFTTLEYLSKELGMQTITEKTRTMQAANQKSAGHDSHGYNLGQRALMTPDELGNMDNSQCVVQIRGLDPFLDYKFDYLKHPRYNRTSDANPDLSYENPLNNMNTVSMHQVEVFSSNIANEQANKAARIFSLEEAIKSNPNWNDYPSIFSEFRSVPATPTEEDDIIDEAAEAMLQNPKYDVPTESDDIELSPPIKTIADALDEFAEMSRVCRTALSQEREHHRTVIHFSMAIGLVISLLGERFKDADFPRLLTPGAFQPDGADRLIGEVHLNSVLHADGFNTQKAAHQFGYVILICSGNDGRNDGPWRLRADAGKLHFPFCRIGVADGNAPQLILLELERRGVPQGLKPFFEYVEDVAADHMDSLVPAIEVRSQIGGGEKGLAIPCIGQPG